MFGQLTGFRAGTDADSEADEEEGEEEDDDDVVAGADENDCKDEKLAEGLEGAAGVEDIEQLELQEECDSREEKLKEEVRDVVEDVGVTEGEDVENAVEDGEDGLKKDPDAEDG